MTGREHLLFYGRLKNLQGEFLKESVEEALRGVNLVQAADKCVRVSVCFDWRTGVLLHGTGRWGAPSTSAGAGMLAVTGKETTEPHSTQAGRQVLGRHEAAPLGRHLADGCPRGGLHGRAVHWARPRLPPRPLGRCPSAQAGQGHHPDHALDAGGRGEAQPGPAYLPCGCQEVAPGGILPPGLGSAICLLSLPRLVVLTPRLPHRAQVLCDRLGIFIDGQLFCIGSPKELSSKFGGYLVLTITTTSEEHNKAVQVSGRGSTWPTPLEQARDPLCALLSTDVCPPDRPLCNRQVRLGRHAKVRHGCQGRATQPVSQSAQRLAAGRCCSCIARPSSRRR